MEVVAIMVLTLPIFFPILINLGFDEIWISILAIMMIEVAVITPPLGTNVFVVKSIVGEDITLEQIFKGIFPFFLSYIIAVILIIIFPKITLWLPSLMKY